MDENNEDNIQYLERILEQNIILCPKCGGSGAMKLVDKTGKIILRGGKPVAQTCDYCYGYGRMGRIVKENLYRLPDAVPPEEPKKNIFTRLLGG